MTENIELIIAQLERDALEPDKAERFYSMSDYQMLAILTSMTEFRRPKITRSAAQSKDMIPESEY